MQLEGESDEGVRGGYHTVQRAEQSVQPWLVAWAEPAHKLQCILSAAPVCIFALRSVYRCLCHQAAAMLQYISVVVDGVAVLHHGRK